MASTPTPRMDAHPTWTLYAQPQREEPREPRLRVWGSYAASFLTVAVGLYAAAGLAELFRYGLLVYNRSRLVPAPLVYASDFVVAVTALAALICAVMAAVSAACWLVDFRREWFASLEKRETRTIREQLAGCLVPVVTLWYPGTLLSEMLTDQRARALFGERSGPVLLRVRIWWGLWVATWVCQGLSLVWRISADTIQAQANGVEFAAFTHFLAAACAVMTLVVMREMVALRTSGRARSRKRWVIAASP
ncbi:DUF4328 domain-containing protein [Hoyosella sp. YIM 151337]|uniref:DUF4328 domain-containing protein n=1 Tax=Hoyosella sp. YIM 151337 TaxID=2992742 RepID=UPI002235ABED|nr:DUF4328 domain-containing protein [Hoyosella sp. YIM 151337]MCW4354652.1 DUF4328 domain-containing protein [Hoyosella sp. YIM 151337]